MTRRSEESAQPTISSSLAFLFFIPSPQSGRGITINHPCPKGPHKTLGSITRSLGFSVLLSSNYSLAVKIFFIFLRDLRLFLVIDLVFVLHVPTFRFPPSVP